MHHVAALVPVLSRCLIAYKLLAGLRMLAFTEPRELLLLHLAGQAPPLCKLALPLTAHAFADRRSLQDVARDVVARRLRLPGGPEA